MNVELEMAVGADPQVVNSDDPALRLGPFDARSNATSNLAPWGGGATFPAIRDSRFTPYSFTPVIFTVYSYNSSPLQFYSSIFACCDASAHLLEPSHSLVAPSQLPLRFRPYCTNNKENKEINYAAKNEEIAINLPERSQRAKSKVLCRVG